MRTLCISVLFQGCITCYVGSCMNSTFIVLSTESLQQHGLQPIIGTVPLIIMILYLRVCEVLKVLWMHLSNIESVIALQSNNIA